MSDNKKVVQQWFDFVSAGEADAAFALFADDIVYELKGTTPVSGVYRGLEEMVNDFFVPWRRQIDGELVVHVDALIAEGDKVVVLAHGEAMTIHKLRYDNSYAFVFSLRDGKITEVVEYLDTAMVETAAYGRTLTGP